MILLYSLTKRTLLLIIILIKSLIAMATIPDSIAINSADTVPDETYTITTPQWAVPVGLTVVGIGFVYEDWLVKQKMSMQNLLSAGHRVTTIDDYMQYLPSSSVYVLNACGVDGKHNFLDRSIILALSYASMGAMVNGLKYGIGEKRPDSNQRNSFPSGHTATAFLGAEFMRTEYADASPWLAYSGYAVAAATGYMRILNNRHYFNDVVVGAGLGILSARLGYWLYGKMFTPSAKKNATSMAFVPSVSTESVSMNFAIRF